MSESPSTSDNDAPMRQFVGFIWIGEDPGIRLSVQARNVSEAKAMVIAEHGQGHVISLWNEDDANKPR